MVASVRTHAVHRPGFVRGAPEGVDPWDAGLDVNHFKRINDDHGHDSVDRVLRTLAGACWRSREHG